MSEQAPEDQDAAAPKRAREKQLETVLDEIMDERGDLFERLADE